MGLGWGNTENKSLLPQLFQVCLTQSNWSLQRIYLQKKRCNHSFIPQMCQVLEIQRMKDKPPLLLELILCLDETENEQISAQIHPICILYILLLHAQRRDSMLSKHFKIHSLGNEVKQWEIYRSMILGFLQTKDI